MRGMKIALTIVLCLSVIAIGVSVYFAIREKEPADYDTHTIVNHLEDYANWDGTTVTTYMNSLYG